MNQPSPVTFADLLKRNVTAQLRFAAAFAGDPIDALHQVSPAELEQLITDPDAARTISDVVTRAKPAGETPEPHAGIRASACEQAWLGGLLDYSYRPVGVGAAVAELRASDRQLRTRVETGEAQPC